MNSRVVVLGMHRSGTSAITRIVNLLGLPICSDPVPGSPDNRAGYWESTSLSGFNERILNALGGAWMCPPSLPPGWVETPQLANFRGEARTVFETVHHTAEWVWKDPRLCLTLPFWRPIIEPTAALLILRDPTAIAVSLLRRNGFPPELSMALWERHTRSALLAARGLPTVIVQYERVLDDPAVTTAKLISDFGKLAIGLDGDPEAAASSVESHRKMGSLLISTLVKNRAIRPIGMTRPQKRLLAVLTSLPSASTSFRPPSLPSETWWTQAALTCDPAPLSFSRAIQKLYVYR